MQELRHAWKAVETARGGPWGYQINCNVSLNDNTLHTIILILE